MSIVTLTVRLDIEQEALDYQIFGNSNAVLDEWIARTNKQVFNYLLQFGGPLILKGRIERIDEDLDHQLFMRFFQGLPVIQKGGKRS